MAFIALYIIIYVFLNKKRYSYFVLGIPFYEDFYEDFYLITITGILVELPYCFPPLRIT